MRGYFTGRFRDRSFTALQAEYRFHIWRWVYGAAFGSEMKEVMKQEKKSQQMLEEAFRGIGYGID